MKKYFRSFVFVVVVALMLIGVGQPRGSAALDKPPFDSVCMARCQFLNLQCFLAAPGKKTEQHKCTAEYRSCIAHCK